MKNRLNKLWKLVVSNKLLVFVGLIFLLVIVPLLLNNIYNHPTADDYTNYNSVADNISQQGFFPLNFINASINRVVTVYMGWQGNFFSIFLSTFHPFFVSFNAYNIYMLAIQVIFIASVMFFFWSLSKIKNLFSLKQTMVMGMTFVILAVSFMFSIQQGFYWYSGVMLYLLPFSVSMIFLGLLIKYILNGGRILYGSLLFLAACLAGTNYTTGLFIVFLMLALSIYFFKKKNNIYRKLILIFVIFSALFAFNVFAPGNFLRISNFTSHVSIFKALLMTIPASFDVFYYAVCHTFTIPVLILFTPAIAKIAHKCKFSFDSPLIITLYTSLVYLVFFAPCAYSYGTLYQEPRVQNIQLLYLFLFIGLIYFYFIGNIVKNKNSQILKSSIFKELCYIFGIFLLIINISVIGINGINSKRVSDEIIYGKSSAFNVCMQENEKKLMDKTSDTAIINNCPPTSGLHYWPLVDGDWVTEDMSIYFKKKVIVKDNW